MKTVVILGAGQAGRALHKMLNPNSIKIIAFGDNAADTWNNDADIPILPVARAVAANPELVLISVLGRDRCQAMKAQLGELGYGGEVICLSDLYDCFDIRSSTLGCIAERIHEQPIPGAIAELGVYRGDFAWQLNALFPERNLYLFDTFAGFDAQDINIERQVSASRAQAQDFSDTRCEDVLARMPYKQQVMLRPGRFPQTADGLEEQFALVSIDVDLYAPTLAGLEYFYPRLSPGGVIILHDYNSRRFDGVKKAVQAYEDEHGRLPLIPLSDLHGTAVIIRS